MVLNEYYTLSNGVKIPKLGLVLQLGMVALPKTAQKIESYGEYSVFPVFSGK